MNECTICYNNVKENSLECGHYCHLKCLEQHFKPECPLCRKKLNIEVKGAYPSSVFSSFSEFENDDSLSVSSSLSSTSFWQQDAKEMEEWNEEWRILGEKDEERMRQREAQSNLINSNWKSKGYSYPEEDSDYDEENPEDNDEEENSESDNYENFQNGNSIDYLDEDNINEFGY